MPLERILDKAKPLKNINFNFLQSLIAYGTAKCIRRTGIISKRSEYLNIFTVPKKKKKISSYINTMYGS